MGDAPNIDILAFDSPDSKSDCVMTLGVRKLHVRSDALCIHSNYFRRIFYRIPSSLSAMKKKKAVPRKRVSEIILENFDPSSFTEFLLAMHASKGGGLSVINETNAQRVLVLARRFECPMVVQRCESVLRQ